MATTSAIVPSGSAMSPPPQMTVSAPMPVSMALSQSSRLNAASITTSRTGSPVDSQRADSPALSTDGAAGTNPPTKRNAFVHKLFAMLSDPALKHLIWWTESEEQNIFALHPGEEFATALTNYFKHGNVASFVRQLHMYGFHKVSDPSNHSSDNNNNNNNAAISASSSNETSGSPKSASKLPVWEFKHSSGKFKKDDESSLKYIKRRSSSNSSRHSFTSSNGAGSISHSGPNTSISHNGPTSVPMHASSDELLSQNSNILPQFQHAHFQQAVLQSPHQYAHMTVSSPMQQPHSQVQPHFDAAHFPYPYMQSPYVLGAPQQHMYTVTGQPMNPATPVPFHQHQQYSATIGQHIQGSIVHPQQIVAPIPQAPYGPHQQYQIPPAAPAVQGPANLPTQTEAVGKPTTPFSQTAGADAERSRTPQLNSVSHSQYQPQYYAPNLQFRKIWESSSTDHSKSLSRPRIPSLLLDPLIPAANPSSLPRIIQSNFTSPVMQNSEAPRSGTSLVKPNTSISNLIRPSLVGMQARSSGASTPNPSGKRSHEESVSSTNSSIFLMRSTSSAASSSSLSFGLGNTVSPKPFSGIPSQVPCRNTSFGAGSFPLLNAKSGSFAIGPTDVSEHSKTQSVIQVAPIRSTSPTARSETNMGVATPRIVPKCKGSRSQTSSPLSQCHSSTIKEVLETPNVKKMSVMDMLNERSDKRRKVD
ncbi:transcription factor Hsr1 [Scheffersomyces spartinae]|uniref:Transcription factor Hsr1 n=1 Tax=Scheffersomyces spartinae TaxID=45513 RepID=A0A9P7V8U3_9ASCO|nr:transcription factor Hsr1 [Scheffersomyces spartinae]KAG7193175.1 transcription factor Hsr1 [Scheffersomyces spartinae]